MKPIRSILPFLVLLQSVQAADLSSIQSFHNGEPFQAGNAAWLVLEFVAPWCSTCIKEAPRMEQTIRDFNAGSSDRADVRFLAINIDRSNSKRTEKFLKKSGLNTLWEDEGARLYNELSGNRGVPFTVLAKIRPEDHQLDVAMSWTGAVPKTDLLNLLNPNP